MRYIQVLWVQLFFLAISDAVLSERKAFCRVHIQIQAVMITLYRVAVAQARKSYRIGLLFTRKNGDFGAISVTERSCSVPISKWSVTHRTGSAQGGVLIRGCWRCAAGWGRIFTTELTIMGSDFQWSYRNGVSHFRIFGVRKFFTFTVSKRTRMFVLWVKSKVFFIQSKKMVN